MENLNQSSKAWRFIINNAVHALEPMAWEGYASFAVWFYKDHKIRGLVQFKSSRNLYVLKTRYCQTANFYPTQLNNKKVQQEYAHSAPPVGGTKHWFGLMHLPSRPLLPPTKTLPVLGMGAPAQDLITLQSEEEDFWRKAGEVADRAQAQFLIDNDPNSNAAYIRRRDARDALNLAAEKRRHAKLKAQQETLKYLWDDYPTFPWEGQDQEDGPLPRPKIRFHKTDKEPQFKRSKIIFKHKLARGQKDLLLKRRPLNII